VPASPRSWLISTGRFRAIDRLRKSRREVSSPPDPLSLWERGNEMSEPEDYDIVDDRLRLIFTCCHPA